MAKKSKNISAKIKVDTSEEPKVTSLVIGDPHFKYKAILDGQDFVEKSIKVAKEYSPSFIVLLGDTLDTHEVVRIDPHILATEWISELSSIAPVYLLIGNHDLKNHKQYLSNKHIFNPLKKWHNVTVVDKPLYAEHGDKNFVFCPYVEPGRFIEALDTLINQGETWEMADCIFGHQEFRGCKMGAIVSEKGDIWDENYPPVITGHIHDSQIVGNVYMPGSAYQHNFGENSNKRIWFVTFGQDDDPGFVVKKIDLGMKKKKIVHLDIDKIDEFDTSILDKYQIKLCLKGSSEQFKLFRSDKKYTSLLRDGVKFSYNRVVSNLQNETTKSGRVKLDEVSFLGMLKKVVSTKNEEIQQIYSDIVGDNHPEKNKVVDNLICDDPSSSSSSFSENEEEEEDKEKETLYEESIPSSEEDKDEDLYDEDETSLNGSEIFDGDNVEKEERTYSNEYSERDYFSDDVFSDDVFSDDEFSEDE